MIDSTSDNCRYDRHMDCPDSISDDLECFCKCHIILGEALRIIDLAIIRVYDGVSDDEIPLGTTPDRM